MKAPELHDKSESVPDPRHPAGGVDRRQFLKVPALLGATATLAGCAPKVRKSDDSGEYPLDQPESVIYSACLQCHTSCTIKCKVEDGVLVKIDGNPYSHMNLQPPLPYDAGIDVAAKVDAVLCPKGQAGIQSLYDPYRLRRVLKRVGPRGGGRWRSIPFEQALDEIVEGGDLFGEGQVPGLRELYAVRDASVAKALAGDAAKVAAGEMTAAEFRSKHGDKADLLVDPEHPDLGPVNNQFVFLAGRIEHGRKEFAKRWLNGGFGSINWYEHTTVCEQSHHIAYQQVSNQYADGKWSGGKTHMKPDAANARFIVYFGTGAFEANFGPTNMASKVTNGLVDGGLKIAVVDPRLSKTAAKAWRWVPIEPGGDTAFALGMVRWILDEERYDARYLACANKAAAQQVGEPTWTSGTWLVKIDNGRPGAFLRAAELGIGGEHEFVVLRDGKPVAVAPNATDQPVRGDLFVRTRLDGQEVKSALQLLRESAETHDIDGWAEQAGVRSRDIADIARELTSHGKRAAVELYRGPVQHTNGFHAAHAIISLNLLIGNVDWKGGLTAGGGHWHEMGDKSEQPFPLKSGLHPGKLEAFGVRNTREQIAYESTSLFRKHGYPAQRPWYPFTNNVYQEVLASAEAGYPYPIKALFLHKGTPVYSTPAGDKWIAYLRDSKRLPLFFACDVVIGETSMYADYIFPDLSIWERWGTPHISPDVPAKLSKIRQPVVAPLVESGSVFGHQVPLCMETVMLGIAERLGMPGYGPDGFAPGMPFERPEDFFLKMAANLAAGDKPGDEVPAASPEEQEWFRKARRHLPPEVFDLDRWKGTTRPLAGYRLDAGELWDRIVFLLDRGGRFEPFDKAYAGDFMGHKFGKQLNFYCEPVGTARNSMSGEFFPGYPVNLPASDIAGKPVPPRSADEFRLITYKEIVGGQSRTGGNYWLLGAMPENYVLMNRRDADRLGIADDEVVRLVSRTNPEGVWDLGNGRRVPIRGKVRVTEGIRPGTIAVSWSYGHWAYGASDEEIDGVRVPGDRRRRGGLCTNALLDVDPVLKNVCLSDPIGGSTSFYDSAVSIRKDSA